MQVSTELKPLFSYSFMPIAIIIILLIILFLIKKAKINKRKKEIIIVPPININELKRKYLIKINELTNNLNSNKITNRKAYQSLSKIIRDFVYEATNIKVQNYTLSDIKKLKLPQLYQLIEEYYDPEFAKISQGNILSSIEKTRKEIEKWN